MQSPIYSLYQSYKPEERITVKSASTVKKYTEKKTNHNASLTFQH